jgi:hypothetical protein
LVVVALLAGVLVGAVAVAPAADALSIVSSPNVSGATTSQLSSVSCTSATFCVGVGSATTSGAVKTLIEHWNGTAWTIKSSPNPVGTAISLYAVSCVSASSCVAVGQYTTGGVIKTLAEHWNGTTWSIKTTVNLAGASSNRLGGVSCVSASSCVAVGASTKSGATKTLVEQYNGTSWAVKPSPAPGTFSLFTAVSCASATSCEAVGPNIGGGGPPPLTAHFDGTSWVQKMAPNPAGAVSTVLTSVSCSSTTNCIAAGNYFDGTANAKPLTESWNGTGWSVLSTPLPAGASSTLLFSISCSTTGCEAVGSQVVSGVTKSLVEWWDGTSWSVLSSPNPLNATSTSLRGVSCLATYGCIAAGLYVSNNVTRTLVVRGPVWTATPTPTVANARNDLKSVSCPSATRCVAVGSSYASGSYTMLIEHWNGTSWTIVSSPGGPSGSSQLNDVSCVAAANASGMSCMAVGFDDSNALAERWDGTSWATVPMDVPPHANTDATRVSCGSATSCWALGLSGLIQQWDGISWSAQSIPTGLTNVVFNAIACVTATDCQAVGSSGTGNQQKGLIAKLTGGTWSVIYNSLPPNEFFDISCSDVNACIAVGSFATKRWDGVTWSTVVTNGNAPARMSCRSANSCEGVAAATRFHWNGTKWTVWAYGTGSSTVKSAEYEGISCAAVTMCIAVGSGYVDSANPQVTFAARYS